MKTKHLFFFLMSAAGAAAAQAPIGVDAQVPPALRNRPTPSAAAGAELRAQALAKLKAQFKAADTDANGSLTTEEAKNFGFVASHFDEIDTRRRGAITFDDLHSYLERVKTDRR